MRRIVIAAGGTGGHFYPGLALAMTLRERGWQPLMLVRREDPALATLEREGIASAEIDLAGMPRAASLWIVPFAWKLAKSLSLDNRILRDFGPRVVVGMGGYLSAPVVFAAAWRGIPRTVHESNAVLGLANRLCVLAGARLFWGLPPMEGPGEVIGTPIRQALARRMDSGEARRRLGLGTGPVVLVFGGSQGARILNREVPKALWAAANAAPGRIEVLHLAGPKDAAEVSSAYEGAMLKTRVLPWLEEMETAYAAADLVVCRAGASTIAELAAQRTPALVVPYAAAAANHQEANARVLERAGAAVVVLEAELEARLPSLLADLLLSERGRERLKAMAQSYERLNLPPPEGAAARLASAVEGLAR